MQNVVHCLSGDASMSRSLTGRRFLQATGVSLALPWLDAFAPSRALAGDANAAQPNRRMVCLCAPLSFYPPHFFPEKVGKDYETTPYQEVLKDFRSDYTIISGLSHAGMSPGFAHQAEASFLTGMPGAGRPGFRNAISLDQFAAEHIGGQTRVSSLGPSGGGPTPPLARHCPPPPPPTSPAPA